MVTGTALCDPEGRLLEEAGQLGSPAMQPAQPERNAQEAQWNLPTWEDIVRMHSARVYRLAYRRRDRFGAAEFGRVGPRGQQWLVFGQVLGGVRKWPHPQQPSAPASAACGVFQRSSR